MTSHEVLDLRGVIEGLWDNARHLDDMQLAVWCELLAGTDADDARAAVVAHARTGAEWPPSPGRIVQATTRSATIGPAPSWPEALAMVRQTCGAYGLRREADGLRALADRSPHVARWAAEAWRDLCLGEIDGQHGGAVEHRWRQDFEQSCRLIETELAERGELRPIVGDRIKQLTAGGGSGGLRVVDPARYLGAGEAA